MRILIISGSVALLLCGCAKNSGIVRTGADTYLVSRQAATGFSGMSTLKADAMIEASDFCSAQGKALKVISTEDAKPPYIFGNFPKTEVQFRCANSESETNGQEL